MKLPPLSKAVGRASLGLLGGLPRGRVARGSAAGLFCPAPDCGGLEGFLVGGEAAFSHELSGDLLGRLGRRYGSGKLPCVGPKKMGWASLAAERMRNRDEKGAAASTASPGSLDGSLHLVAARMAR